MLLADFLQHYRLTENPFAGEEARADTVFERMSTGQLPSGPLSQSTSQPVATGATPHSSGLPDGAVLHSDFSKILGDLRRPSSAVVFGEKGSGKTAIRLQIARAIERHNATFPGARVLLVSYDDLNPALTRIHESVRGKTYLESLQKTRLVDHIDAVLHLIVPRIVTACLGEVSAQTRVGEMPATTVVLPDSAANDRKTFLKGLNKGLRRELLLLQSLYDRAEAAPERTIKLRRALGLWPSGGILWARIYIYLVPLLILGALVYTRFFMPQLPLRPDAPDPEYVIALALAVFTGFYVVLAFKFGVWNRLSLLRTAHKVRRQLRVISRGDLSFARSLRELKGSYRTPAHVPVSDADESRFAALERAQRILRSFGYTGIIVVVDRADEPPIVGGDPDRMRAAIWPMLNNKFLQQVGIGFKLLLPMELKHAVFRESSAFFQEARLDKQAMVEQLAWTGPMLFDLCDARLKACAADPAAALSLMDLFDQDVTRAEVVEALSRVFQPRDAFKLLYRAMNEHCAQVTRSQDQWRIPRSILTAIAKSEGERVLQMQRGIRPA